MSKAKKLSFDLDFVCFNGRAFRLIPLAAQYMIIDVSGVATADVASAIMLTHEVNHPAFTKVDDRKIVLCRNDLKAPWEDVDAKAAELRKV